MALPEQERSESNVTIPTTVESQTICVARAGLLKLIKATKVNAENINIALFVIPPQYPI